jgi:hypothetical protein
MASQGLIRPCKASQAKACCSLSQCHSLNGLGRDGFTRPYKALYGFTSQGLIRPCKASQGLLQAVKRCFKSFRPCKASQAKACCSLSQCHSLNGLGRDGFSVPSQGLDNLRVFQWSVFLVLFPVFSILFPKPASHISLSIGLP